MPCCKIDRKKTIDRDKFTFSYTPDSFLFFKNVRQIYYDFQDLPEAKWHAYRFSDRYKGTERPSINPVIVVDWMRDEASILIEPNELLLEETTLMVREKNKNGKLYEYALKERGRENMLEFATKIYEGIVAENEIFIEYKGTFTNLFADEEDADNFRIVLGDYYRLTNVMQ